MGWRRLVRSGRRGGVGHRHDEEPGRGRGRTLDEITILRRRVKDVWGLGRLIGRSAPMQEVHRLIEQAAATPAPINTAARVSATLLRNMFRPP